MRKAPWKRIGLVAVVLLLGWVLVEIVLAGRGTPPIPVQQNGITLKGGHVQGNRISSKSWSFDYTSAKLSSDGTTGTVEGVRNGIVLRKGKPYLRVSAEHISVDTQSLNFTAVGKVHVVVIGDPEHRSFDTDLVVWTNGAKLLHMDHPSYLHSGDQTLKISNATINFDTGSIHLGGISGNVQMPNT
ncbi:MAG TPA: hypothetical protein VFN49_10165 [Candidatus Aquilonibacter sp.]|nr:hypothetical protein [Candidatus Aquilonibacter sp.]